MDKRRGISTRNPTIVPTVIIVVTLSGSVVVINSVTSVGIYGVTLLVVPSKKNWI